MTVCSPVELYGVAVGDRLPASQLELALAVLPRDDQERLLRYRRWEDVQRGLLAAHLARLLLSRHLGLPDQELRIRRDALGRPFVTGAGQWCGDFNLSHSGNWVVGAITASGRVGVDVEAVHSIDLTVANHCFTTVERSALYSQPESTRLSVFFNLWTLKEAYVKALGTGLSRSLTSLGFEPDQLEAGPIRVLDEGAPMLQWHFKCYPLDPLHKLALCSDNPVLPDRLIMLNRGELLSQSALPIRR